MYDKEYFKMLLASFLRVLLAAGGTWFVEKGVGTQGQWEFLIAGVALFIVNAVSILYAKYKGRLRFLAALNAAPGTSETVVKANPESFV
jgi:hypothetical protein